MYLMNKQYEAAEAERALYRYNMNKQTEAEERTLMRRSELAAQAAAAAHDAAMNGTLSSDRGRAVPVDPWLTPG